MVPAHGPLPPGPNQPQMTPQQMMGRSAPGEQLPPGQPVLYLLSLNGTFERKTIAVPFAPESLRIGRQTNQKTVPTPANGFFDSKVLSRQHAEIHAERNGKIYIRDVKSSNGTFVNGTRLSQENRESEPHELQTGDHLELGIDIVSEDQKTVVHHKVAAKVEHAGFMSASNSVLDMNFGDLDPANSSMMMPGGAIQMRGRAGSNASSNNGRMMPNGAMGHPGHMSQQRSFFLSPIATDQILKRLSTEMRNARLQGQDLGRTNQFIHTLLSKDDVKDLEKPEPSEPARPQHMVNGNGKPFRSDPKARFSEPPAPPPQQPLPEKPDAASLKRGPTERPRVGASNASPVRSENPSQILQLTEALNNAKKDFDSQTMRMRELEEMLQKERVARELAEDMAKRLEESANARLNGIVSSAPEPPLAEETAVGESTEPKEETQEDNEESETAAKKVAAALQARIDSMDAQMLELREQMTHWKQRCESAEAERDADRKTLAEMVVQLRAEEERRIAQEKARSRSRGRRTEGQPEVEPATSALSSSKGTSSTGQLDGSTVTDATPEEEPTLSRANTVTPLTPGTTTTTSGRQLQASLPYASAVSVVLIGMGLMAYLNGWQAPPPRVEQ